MPAPAIEIVVAEDAGDRLAAWIAGRPALVVMDVNTQRAGERLLEALGDIRTLVFPQREGLLAGPAEAAAVRERRQPGEILLSMGSGVITDIVRHAAHELGAPFVSVPTAASMDGYASSVAAMQFDGVKVTTPARAPVAIFAEPQVLAAAPTELTRAGIGDLLAKATALVDWQAAHLLLGEPYDARVAADVRALVERTAAAPELLLAGDAEATRQLLVGLIESGLAIARVGNSRPASGCEHHASHFWDLLAARGRRPHHLHGLQVGYATHFAMRLQRFAYAGGLASLQPPNPPADPLGPEARAWLGEPTEEIITAVEEKRAAVTPLPASWPASQDAWQQTCAALSPALEPFGRVAAALERTGIPAAPGFLGIEAELLGATFHHATRLRARFTVVDLLESQGRLADSVAAALYQ